MENGKRNAASSREELLNSAVKFLQHEKTRSAKVSVTKEFLEKKGLTKEEIDLAIEQSGIQNIENDKFDITNEPINRQLKSGSVIKNALIYGSVIVGGLYGIYQFVRNFLQPLLRGEESETDRLVRVNNEFLESTKSIDGTLKQLSETLRNLDSTITEQQVSIRKISNEIETSKYGKNIEGLQEQQHINDIKKEIISVKGLLLGRKQFPPPPETTPIIPSWQKGKKTSPQSNAEKSESVSPSALKDTALSSDSDIICSEKSSSCTKIDTVPEKIPPHITSLIKQSPQAKAETTEFISSSALLKDTALRSDSDIICSEKSSSWTTIDNVPDAENGCEIKNPQDV